MCANARTKDTVQPRTYASNSLGLKSHTSRDTSTGLFSKANLFTVHHVRQD